MDPHSSGGGRERADAPADVPEVEAARTHLSFLRDDQPGVDV